MGIDKTDGKIYAIIPTNKCDLRCRYCYSNKNYKNKSMNREIAIKTVNHISQDIINNNLKFIQIIFEGNEPLLNIKIVKLIISLLSEKLKNRALNRLDFSIFTNLQSMDEDIFEYIRTNKIYIHTSLDGNRQINDMNRGQGVFKKTVYWIRRFQKEDMPINVSAVITRFSLSKYEDIIETYISLGLNSINLRYLHRLGEGKVNWQNLGYRPTDYLEFWERALKYIIRKNTQPILFFENKALFIFNKLIKNIEKTYLYSPLCTAITKQLCYDPQGDIYTCDEGRNNPGIHKIGDVENGLDSSKVMRFFNLIKMVEKSNCKIKNIKCNIYGLCNPCLALNDPYNICHPDRCQAYRYGFDFIKKIIRDKKILNMFSLWNKI